MAEKKQKKTNPIVGLNYFRLTYRSALFLIVAFIVIRDKIFSGVSINKMMSEHQVILGIIWVVFIYYRDYHQIHTVSV